jgi:tetratricopeptide (TPR) repeat protein
MGALIHLLQGREQVLRARQMIAAACLNQAEEHVRTATNLLPAADQLFQEVRDTLRQKQTFVHFSRHQATTYAQQHELSSALHSIQEALSNNREDQEAEAIRANLEEEIREVQELARQAAELEHTNLPQALVQWQEIHRRHTDGSYPPANPRPFARWEHEVQQRIETSRLRIEQTRTEFQNLRDWLVEQKRPEWSYFHACCRQVLAYLSEVEPGMRDEQISRIEAAVHWLERYGNAYQQLEQVLKPGTGQPAGPAAREQAIKEFQAIRSEIHIFNGKDDKLFQNFATSVQTSYDRMDRLLKYT